MRPLGVVVADPLPDHFPCMADRFKAMLPDTLFLQTADETLHHAVLLGAVRRDEFLLQPVGPDSRRVAPGGEDQPIVTAQQQRPGNAPQMPIASTRFCIPSLIAAPPPPKVIRPTRNMPNNRQMGASARCMYFWRNSETAGIDMAVTVMTSIPAMGIRV